MKETYDFLKECGVFYLATIDGNHPRVRPFGALNIFEDKLYILTGKVKSVSKQIDKNENVEICGFKDGKWIRVDAKVVRDDRLEAKASMLDFNPELKGQYDVNDNNTEVLYLKDVSATIYSFVNRPITFKF